MPFRFKSYKKMKEAYAREKGAQALAQIAARVDVNTITIPEEENITKYIQDIQNGVYYDNVEELSEKVQKFQEEVKQLRKKMNTRVDYLIITDNAVEDLEDITNHEDIKRIIGDSGVQLSTVQRNLYQESIATYKRHVGNALKELERKINAHEYSSLEAALDSFFDLDTVAVVRCWKSEQIVEIENMWSAYEDRLNTYRQKIISEYSMFRSFSTQPTETEFKKLLKSMAIPEDSYLDMIRTAWRDFIGIREEALDALMEAVARVGDMDNLLTVEFSSEEFILGGSIDSCTIGNFIDEATFNLLQGRFDGYFGICKDMNDGKYENKTNELEGVLLLKDDIDSLDLPDVMQVSLYLRYEKEFKRGIAFKKAKGELQDELLDRFRKIMSAGVIAQGKGISENITNAIDLDQQDMLTFEEITSNVNKIGESIEADTIGEALLGLLEKTQDVVSSLLAKIPLWGHRLYNMSLGVVHLRTFWKINQNLQNSKKNSSHEGVQAIVDYTLNKRKVAFRTKVFSIVISVLETISDVVSFVASACPVALAVVAACRAVFKTLKVAHKVYRAAKAVWKTIKGTKGKNREKNTRDIMTWAFYDRNDEALKFLYEHRLFVKEGLSVQILQTFKSFISEEEQDEKKFHIGTCESDLSTFEKFKELFFKSTVDQRDKMAYYLMEMMKSQ